MIDGRNIKGELYKNLTNALFWKASGQKHKSTEAILLLI